jgi:hypothetical protein
VFLVLFHTFTEHHNIVQVDHHGIKKMVGDLYKPKCITKNSKLPYLVTMAIFASSPSTKSALDNTLISIQDLRGLWP